MKIISFSDLEAANSQGLIYDFERPSDHVLSVRIARGFRKESCLLENVSFEDVGNHLAVIHGVDRVFLKYPGFLQKNQSRFLILAVLIALAGILNPRGHGIKDASKALDFKVQELSQIQNSLMTLSDYVASQRSTLQQTQLTLNALNEQKGEVERVLSIQRPQLDALINVVNHDSEKQRWFERGFSFILGFGSSVLATMFLSWVQDHRRKHIPL